ncbi:unnamed protein product [Gongylonema pulchrum]|uniref:Ras-associating domain-containing protein n=1 Tax=Gongylonema pulchrum TaxID=637853 RepID=A0A183E4X0_9BILA|nr:unnamed protein product [Gongylonema pulchrum]
MCLDRFPGSARSRNDCMQISRDKKISNCCNGYVTARHQHPSSRHEQFSDTIFWTIKLVFRQEQGEGPERAIIEYEHTVNNIPESISVATLLRQFIKPKKVGPVVSESDLDAEKLLPFQKAGIEQLMVYMPVPLDGKQRFYVIDPSKTILDNTRNRYILEHPTLIVTLNSQFGDYVMLSEQESQELRELQRQKNRDENANVRFNNVWFILFLWSQEDHKLAKLLLFQKSAETDFHTN